MSTPVPPARAVLPSKVYITSSALRVMSDEAALLRAQGSVEDETGGVLFGRRLDRGPQVELLIVAATGPGEQAFHRPSEFRPDVDYVNEQLKRLYAEYPRLDYIGTWHKHPSHFRRFSQGDVRTAHEAFGDPSYKMYEIVNPIVWVDGEQITIRYYYMNRPMAEERQPFAELAQEQIVEISDVDELVTSETVAALSPQTRQRLSEERRKLVGRGYEVAIHERDHEYYFTLTHPGLPQVKIYLIAPRGYPRVPPAVFAERDGADLAASDGGVIGGWMLNPGASSLADVADGVHARILAPPGPPERPRWQRWLFALAVGLVAAIVGLFAWQSLRLAEQRDAYASDWADIGAWLDQGDEVSLKLAADALRTIRAQDPLGRAYPRNSEATPLLRETLVRLAQLVLAVEPPKQTEALGYYNEFKALGDLDAEPPAATAAAATIESGLLQIANIEATAVARESTWATIEQTQDAGRRIELIIGLLAAGVEVDPDGLPAARRLFDELLASVTQLVEQPDLTAAEQRARAALALVERYPDVLSTRRGEANDALATVLLAEARAARFADNAALAGQKLDAVVALQPSAGLLAAAAAERDLIAADQELLNLELQKYDAALAGQGRNWDEAFAILNRLIAQLGPNPSAAEFPSPPFDRRIPRLYRLKVETHFAYGLALQLGGRLREARIQYETVRNDGNALEEERAAARKDLDELGAAQALWATVSNAFRSRAWAAAINALEGLASLDGFGPEALQPGTGRSVKGLLAEARAALARQLVTPTPSPEPTASPVPTPSPEPTASPVPTPVGVVTYQLSVREISFDELRRLAKVDNVGAANTYVAAPSGLLVEILNTGTGASSSFKSDSRLVTLGDGPLTLRVIVDDSGLPFSSSEVSVSPKANSYYEISIVRGP